jgi:hypothetical protein
MAKYQTLKTVVKVPSALTRGSFLAHNKFDRIARAFIAADLHSGARQLVHPTLTQAAALAGVNRTYAFWATRRLAERAAIEAGFVPLVPALPVASKTNGGTPPAPKPIVELDELGLLALVRSVGVSKILDVAAAVEAGE